MAKKRTDAEVIALLARALGKFRSGGFCWCQYTGNRGGNHTPECVLAGEAMAEATFKRGIALSSQMDAWREAAGGGKTPD